MTDPFQDLRLPARPVDPDPAFASALRARLERAVLDPSSVTETPMTTTLSTPSTSLRLHTLTPYLAVVDAAAAVAFYVDAFGATRRGDPIVMPDGRTGHVEVALGDSVLMMADEYPEIGLDAPISRGGATSQSLRLEVSDPDAVVAAAIAAGGTLERPVTDSPYGRGGVVIDPSGHRWMVSREPAQLAAGDIAYVSLWTRDVARAARFFGAVLGWQVEETHGGRGRHVMGQSQSIGLWPTDAAPTAFLCYAVADVDGALALVRAAGGTAQEPDDAPHGRVADCVDDQGVAFALHQGVGLPRPAVDPGGVSYVDVRSADPVATRAFYATVLGYRYLPGTDPGYWHPQRDGIHPFPMAGMAQGQAAVVPTFTVADLDSALTALVAAGGRTTSAAGERHGQTVQCVDDQGMAFALQQH